MYEVRKPRRLIFLIKRGEDCALTSVHDEAGDANFVADHDGPGGGEIGA